MNGEGLIDHAISEDLVDAIVDRVVAELRIEMSAIVLGDDRLLSERDAAKMLGISEYTLQEMRRSKTGPPSVSLGGGKRKFRYSLGGIRRWSRARCETRSS